MKRSKYARRGVLLMLANAMVPSLASAVNIYQFGSGMGAQVNSVGGASASGTPQADAIGGRLDHRFTFVSGAGYVRTDTFGVLSQDSLSTSVGLNRLVFDADGSTDATTVTPNGLGSVDLTDGGASNAILVDVYFNDVPASLTLTIHSNGGANQATSVLNLTPLLLDPLTPTTLSLPFSTFTAPVDFTDVGAIVVEITGDAGSDILLDNLRTGAALVNPTPPLPTIAPAFTPPSPGATIIDLFDGSSAGADDTTGNASFGAGSLALPQVLGSFRTLEVEDGAVADPGSVTARSIFGFNTSGFEDTLYISSDATLGLYDVTVAYDGNNVPSFNPAGLGSVDLTDGGANQFLQLGVLSNDIPVDILFEVFSAAGSQVSTATFTVPGLLPAGATFLLPFSSFVGTADFTDISGLRVSFVSGFGQDLRIDYLAAVGDSNAIDIPEPATAALGLVALGGLMRRRRRTV